jgi:hypothetical protein
VLIVSVLCNLLLVVMCRLWPEARSQAKPGLTFWPETAFGLTWVLEKDKAVGLGPGFLSRTIFSSLFSTFSAPCYSVHLRVILCYSMLFRAPPCYSMHLCAILCISVPFRASQCTSVHLRPYSVTFSEISLSPMLPHDPMICTTDPELIVTLLSPGPDLIQNNNDPISDLLRPILLSLYILTIPL